MKNTKFVIAAIASVLFAQSANAAQYILNYSGTKLGQTAILFATLKIDTADFVNGGGGYDVNSVTGTVDGETVLGLIANPNTPGTTQAAGFVFNNILFNANPAFDLNGLAFTTSTGSWNLWGTDTDAYTLMKYAGGRYTGAVDGQLSVAAVPEPASWAMLITGFGMIGAATRRRRFALTA